MSDDPRDPRFWPVMPCSCCADVMEPARLCSRTPWTSAAPCTDLRCILQAGSMRDWFGPPEQIVKLGFHVHYVCPSCGRRGVAVLGAALAPATKPGVRLVDVPGSAPWQRAAH